MPLITSIKMPENFEQFDEKTQSFFVFLDETIAMVNNLAYEELQKEIGEARQKLALISKAPNTPSAISEVRNLLDELLEKNVFVKKNDHLRREQYSDFINDLEDPLSKKLINCVKKVIIPPAKIEDFYAECKELQCIAEGVEQYKAVIGFKANQLATLSQMLDLIINAIERNLKDAHELPINIKQIISSKIDEFKQLRKAIVAAAKRHLQIRLEGPSKNKEYLGFNNDLLRSYVKTESDHSPAQTIDGFHLIQEERYETDLVQDFVSRINKVFMHIVNRNIFPDLPQSDNSITKPAQTSPLVAHGNKVNDQTIYQSSEQILVDYLYQYGDEQEKKWLVEKRYKESNLFWIENINRLNSWLEAAVKDEQYKLPTLSNLSVMYEFMSKNLLWLTSYINFWSRKIDRKLIEAYIRANKVAEIRAKYQRNGHDSMAPALLTLSITGAAENVGTAIACPHLHSQGKPKDAPSSLSEADDSAKQELIDQSSSSKDFNAKEDDVALALLPPPYVRADVTLNLVTGEIKETKSEQRKENSLSSEIKIADIPSLLKAVSFTATNVNVDYAEKILPPQHSAAVSAINDYLKKLQKNIETKKNNSLAFYFDLTRMLQKEQGLIDLIDNINKNPDKSLKDIITYLRNTHRHRSAIDAGIFSRARKLLNLLETVTEQNYQEVLKDFIVKSNVAQFQSHRL